MDATLSFYFFPNYKGKTGKLPVFMYPGPKYQVFEITEYNMTAYPPVGEPGKYIIRTWTEKGEEREESTVWTDAAEKAVDAQLKATYDEYERKFNAFMETFDQSEITEFDREAAAFMSANRQNGWRV